MPITSSNISLESIIEETSFIVEVAQKYKIKIVNNPILIGFGSVKLGYYDKYVSPCSFYQAVEIEYYSINEKLDKDSEYKVLKSFLYELSYLYKDSIDFTKMIVSGYEDYYDHSDFQTINLDYLRPYSEGMDLFTKALESHDIEISFLYFYKIIEFYSPVAAKILAFETLSRKLEGIKYKKLKNDDLNKIFEISDAYRRSKSDNEITQTVLTVSIDIVELFPKLPESIAKKISKASQFDSKNLNYSTPIENIKSLINQLSKILYSTRNSIVHAKSNFNSDGNECNPTDLEKLNDFLREATYQIINWYSKLPDYIRSDD